ncbi:hypothetical protein [Streptomyces sp. RFCAC02]|uniref:hypothetical protein n=1 Tax=Streptomyces sp. RFCAC02 TaxID=2499143 RepID=UPI001021DC39|nr:hypothetical protein [Streptomyces sp. RFCAC02]
MTRRDRRRTIGAAPKSVQERVRTQAAVIAAAVFTIFLPMVLVVLATTSAWTGWVNVMAMHTYLDRPGTLPGATWAVPIAVQAFIIVGEATMVLHSVLRRRWIMISGATATALGYGVEIGAHIHYGESADTVVTMVVAAVACGGGWALAAALMDRGVEIADEEPAGDERSATTGTSITTIPDDGGERDQPRSGADQDVPRRDAPLNERTTAPDAEPESAPTPSPLVPTRKPDATDADTSSAAGVLPPKPNARKRRSHAELLREVRALDPDRTTLSPNYVAERIGVSWTSAKSLLSEVGRLATADQRTGARRTPPPTPTWSAPRTSWSTGQRP